MNDWQKRIEELEHYIDRCLGRIERRVEALEKRK